MPMACTSRSRNGSACDSGPTLMSHRSSASWKSCPLPRVQPCSVTSSRTCFHERTNVKTARPCQAHKQKNASVFRQRKRTMCTLLTQLHCLGYSRGCCAQRPRDRKPQRLAAPRMEFGRRNNCGQHRPGTVGRRVGIWSHRSLATTRPLGNRSAGLCSWSSRLSRAR